MRRSRERLSSAEDGVRAKSCASCGNGREVPGIRAIRDWRECRNGEVREVRTRLGVG